MSVLSFNASCAVRRTWEEGVCCCFVVVVVGGGGGGGGGGSGGVRACVRACVRVYFAISSKSRSFYCGDPTGMQRGQKCHLVQFHRWITFHTHTLSLITAKHVRGQVVLLSP